MRRSKFLFALVILLEFSPLVSTADPDPVADISSVSRAAERQFDSGNYTGAIATLQSAMGSDSSNAVGYYWLGRCYYELHDYDQAVANGEKSVALDPKNSVYHDWLGREYGGKADKEHSFFIAKRVKKEFQLAVQLDPSNMAAREDLEDFDLNAPWLVGGNKDEAKDQAQAIASTDGLEGHIAMGKYQEEGPKRLDAAEAEFRQVLTAQPAKLGPYLELIEFYMRQNRPTDMQMVIDAAQKVALNDPRLSYYRGVALVLSDTDLNHAEEYLKSYLASTPDRSNWPPHAAAREWLGRLDEEEGKPAEAAEQYRAALQLDPNRKQARVRLEKLEKN